MYDIIKYIYIYGTRTLLVCYNKKPKGCLDLNLPLFGMCVGELCIVVAWGGFDGLVTGWVDDGTSSLIVVSNLRI